MINKLHLPNQKNDEQVVAHIWPHPIVFIKIFVIYLALLLIPLAVYFFILTATPQFLESEALLPVLSVICFAYYLVILLMAISVWVQNYLDVWTITSKRIISREQHGLFNRVVSEVELFRVQDVTVEQKGFLPTMLHYGDIVAQSAGAEQTTILRQVPHADIVARQILELAEASRRRQGNGV